MKRKKLDKFFIDNDLIQTEVAESLGITDNHLSLLINGKANPSFGLMEKFEKFCEELGLEVDDMWELWKKE